ncbi:hypothetical protein RHGRI_035133 [Rhododendron griersonianum]|uniref:Uncharacterized protein n=1 Tax=Rhododendron griersonianum TaxID=479676 RepID=A0AAV6I645_9ERIC|nr:hypothetical protein RHGRI_035133 [Rhododendron griersonianum]
MIHKLLEICSTAMEFSLEMAKLQQKRREVLLHSTTITRTPGMRRAGRPVALAKREVPHLDTAEKQMLLKEVRLSKAKRKEAEIETERLRPASESGRERHSLKSMLSKHSVSKSEAFSDGRGVRSNATMASQSGRSRSQSTDFVI